MEQGRELVEKYFKAVNAADLDAVRAVLTPDVEFSAPGPVAGGADMVVAWMGPFLSAFPGIDHQIVNLVESGDDVATEITVKGTHTEPMVTPQGELAPTGKSIELKAVNVMRVRDGRIAALRIYFDQMSFMGQLGLLPG